MPPEIQELYLEKGSFDKNGKNLKASIIKGSIHQYLYFRKCFFYNGIFKIQALKNMIRDLEINIFAEAGMIFFKLNRIKSRTGFHATFEANFAVE